MRIRLDLDEDTTHRLIEDAVANRRPLVMQAEVILRRGLGLPVPVPLYPVPDRPDAPADQPAPRVGEADRE